MKEGDLQAYNKALKRKSQTPPYMEDYQLEDPLRNGLLRFDAEKLVSLVKTRRALYDFNSKGYYNKDTIDRLWREVASEMGMNVLEAKSKWMGLRNSYARCLRLKSYCSNGKKRRPWYLSHSMSFLSEFMGQNRHPPRLGFESSSQDSLQELASNNSQYRTIIINDDSGELATATICDQLSATVCDSTEIRSTRSPSPVIVQPSTQQFSSWVQQQDSTDDPDLLFLRSMLPDIKKLSRKRRLEYKAKIFSLLSHMLDEDEEDSEKSIVFTIKEESDD